MNKLAPKAMLAIVASLTLCTMLSSCSTLMLFTKKKEKESTEIKKESDYDKLFKDKHTSESGFIDIHRFKDKLYFELPVALLGRDMLLGSTISEISDNGNAIIGSKPLDPIHFKFEKSNDKICLNKVQTDQLFVGVEEDIAAALKRNSIDATIAVFKIKTYNNDKTTVLFEVSDFFAKENKLMPVFDPNGMYSEYTLSEMFKSSESYIDSFKAFEDNISIRSVMTYTYSLSSKTKGKIYTDEPFTAAVTRSIILLDEEPYRPRLTDSRIAIFPTQKMQYSMTDQRTKAIYYANRWRLEPSDTVAYRAGKCVEPVKPIVFYVDNTFSEIWRGYIKEGVNQWNELFETIGFKNAIKAVDFPEDDPEFDPDNIKYSCIRYAPITVENAMGPSWVDPRSGEIINASVYVYHDVIKILNNWLFVQTSPADKRVRSENIPTEIIGDGLRYVISHEVGHCLGFMHNMSASAQIPVDSLRSPSFTQRYGTTTSIMDYARFNYVAQPGDFERGVKLTPPRFGQYDKFLIEWNYTPVFDVTSAEEEYAVTSKWLSDKSHNPLYRYGKQQSEILDPRSQTEDLSDDAVKASNYGVSNLKYIMANLNSWLEGEDEDYSYHKDIYNSILRQYMGYLGHVYGNIGGVYMDEKHVGDGGHRIKSVPEAKQKEALEFLLAQLSDIDWLDEADVLETLPLVGSPAEYMRGLIMKLILSAPEKVEFAAKKASAEDAYTVDECMDNIYSFVWAPTIQNKSLTDSERKLQNMFISQVASSAGVKFDKSSKSLAINSLTPAYQSACLNNPRELNAFERSISGYSEPMADFFVPKSLSARYFGMYDKILTLLKSRVSTCHDKNTKLHYQLLIHRMSNSLK